jgi:uncharacterized protein YtpQ (UPF0354 family)
MKFVRLLLCTIGFTGCAKGPILSEDEFAHEFVALLSKAAPSWHVEAVKDLELRVTDKEGKTRTIFLNNCYSEYKSNPQDKDSIVRKYLAAYTEGDFSQHSVDPKRITPVIKDVSWLSDVRQSLLQRGAKQLPEYVSEPLNAQLVILYAEDSPKNLRYLTPKDLQSAGIKREELKAMAVNNLRTIIPKIEVRGAQGVFMITAGGDYEASLLLFDDIWTGQKIAVSGDYVVAIPARDTLLVTGSNDKAGIAKIKEIAAGALKDAPYRLTGDLFVYRGGQFIKFEE